MSNNGSSPLVLWYNQLGMNDVDRVGGKNASLGEMITNLSGMGVSVPNGFATTADAFDQFLDQSGVNQRIYALLDETDIDDVSALAKAGAQIRQWIIDTPFQSELENAIREAYDLLSADDAEASFAVRSSATAEDMPDASFAGQQETFLNVQGFDAVLVAVKHVFASLFNDRAISYRVHQGYDHRGVALSAGVQRMVRSDLASSGVMFSIDTESGFDQVVFITSAWGLGEMVVQGAVNPDEFYVHKPTLAANRPAIVRRTMGSKKIRMVYAPTQEHGKQVRIEDVPQAQRDVFSLTNEEVEELAKQGYNVTVVKPRPDGTLDINEMLEHVDKNTILVACMMVNNEVGTRNDVKRLAAEVKRRNSRTIVHVDAVQAWMRVPIKLTNIDTLSVSGHKIHAPKGIGALYLSARLVQASRPPYLGGEQERGLRPGTENLPYAMGLAAAATRLAKTMKSRDTAMKALNQRLRDGLKAFPEVELNSPENAVPEVLNFSEMCIKSETMLAWLAEAQVYVSSASACGRGQPSHTLAAMGKDPLAIDTAIRVSFCGDNTPEDVDAFLNRFEDGMKSLQRIRK